MSYEQGKYLPPAEFKRYCGVQPQIFQKMVEVVNNGQKMIIMNSLPKFGASTTLEEAEWNASVIEGNVAEEVAGPKQQPVQDILIYGSADLVRTLMRHGLIDEYRLWVHPIVAGSGKRLLGEGRYDYAEDRRHDDVQFRRRSLPPA